MKLPQHVYETILEFQKEYPSAMLTGTCALMLYGFDLGRQISDVDFILPVSPDPIPNNWQETQMPENFQAKCYWHQRNGFKVEAIIWDEYVAMIVDGIRVTSIYEIIEEKKNLGLTGTKKHLLDFHRMLLQTIPLSLSQLTAPVNYSKFAILNKKEIT